MTTVAYKDGVMAADSQATCDFHTRVRKIRRMQDGTLIGGCGSTKACHAVLEWLAAGQEGKPPKMAGAWFIVVPPNGKVYYAEEQWPPFPVNSSFGAIGSGASVAVGAMEAGASALQAVKIAAKHDGYTSAPFHTIKLK